MARRGRPVRNLRDARLGAALQAVRVQAGLTQAEAAALISKSGTSCSPATVRMVEMGRRNPSRGLVDGLLAAAGVSEAHLRELLDREGPAPDGSPFAAAPPQMLRSAVAGAARWPGGHARPPAVHASALADSGSWQNVPLASSSFASAQNFSAPRTALASAAPAKSQDPGLAGQQAEAARLLAGMDPAARREALARMRVIASR